MESTFITLNDFKTVSRSKKETYDKLTIFGRYYLPPIEQVDCDFISDIMDGTKNVRFQVVMRTGSEVRWG